MRAIINRRGGPPSLARPANKAPANWIRAALLSAAAAALLAVAGCNKRASFADPPSYQPEQPTQFFADGNSSRPLVSGVVPRPVDASPGIPYVRVKSPGRVDSDGSATSEKIPFAVTDAMLRRGQERFDIYCVVCHGRTGTGDGAVVQRGFTRPPSFYRQDLLDAPDSHFYDVITNGKGAMFSYNDRIAPDDRWAIVAYIRALQYSYRQISPASQPAGQGGAR
ncbi:MAG TPA: cytochrome c [Tepidisphaeraceae bacterium]|nr:cytochrome c [Tepidisphaeraceae bacterium]